MNRSTVSRVVSIGVLGAAFGFFSSSISVFAYTCPSSVAVSTLGADWKDISGSCEALMDTMDATQIKRDATNLCCKNAIEYLQKNPMPCSEKSKVLYRIKLGLTVCDKLTNPIYDYEHDYCVNQMLYHIFDSKVLSIADKCSPSGGRAAGGGKRGGGGGAPGAGRGSGKPDDVKPSAGPSSEAEAGAGDHSHHHHDKADGEGGAPLDLHLDDESYSKCQRKRLNEYMSELQEEIKKDPSEAAACSKSKP
jgi:hypothetical protein